MLAVASEPPLMRVAKEQKSAAVFPVFSMMDFFDAFCNANPEVKATHRSLFYALLSVARKRGGILRFALPYQDGMERSCIGSRSTYIAALESLQAWGIIKYTPGRNGYQAPIIELCLPSMGDIAIEQFRLYNSRSDAPVDAHYFTSTSTSTEHLPVHLVGTFNKEVSNEVKKVPNTAARAAESELSKLRKALAACQTEQQILDYWATLSQKPEKGTKEHSAFRERREELLFGFDVFWAAYDHKVGSKSKAKVAWDKLSTEVRSVILVGLKGFKASLRDKQFQPHATTFLNGKLWEAETYGKATVATPAAPANPPSVATLTDEQRQRQLEAMRARNANQPIR